MGSDPRFIGAHGALEDVARTARACHEATNSRPGHRAAAGAYDGPREPAVRASLEAALNRAGRRASAGLRAEPPQRAFHRAELAERVRREQSPGKL